MGKYIYQVSITVGGLPGHPASLVYHNTANGIKPGSDSKKTDKHAVDCSKAVCWGVK